MKAPVLPACPCGGPAAYADCCGPWHAGAAAPTAEALMRSRYTAFVQGRRDYLLATWHPRTRPSDMPLDDGMTWLGLTVRATQATGPHAATVEFVARSRRGGGRAQRQHECSRFVREHDRWWYVDGDAGDTSNAP